MCLSRKCGIYRGKVVINRRGDVPKTNAHYKTNNQSACHPELVELLWSEQRRRSASHKAKRDLATTFGGLPRGCYIDSKATRICLEIPSSLSLLGFSSLLAQKNFDKLRMTG